MVRSLKVWLLAGAAGLACANVALVTAAPGEGNKTGNGAGAGPATNATAPLKPLLAEEVNQLEKEIAARMMRRGAGDMPADRRARLEQEIDLRIVERAIVALAADAKHDSTEQAVAWLRGKQLRDAVRGIEDALGQSGSPTTATQKEAAAQLHRLSFAAAEQKGGKELDDYCRAIALAMASAASETPVEARALPRMRPQPIAGDTGPAKDAPPTVGELTQQVQTLAAVSVQLRQQLLALASAAATAGEKDDGRALYAMLAQSVGLARGLQSNTAVGPDARAAIEGQLAEGIVLFADPRTRDAGHNRVEALGQYRQTLTRIGKLGLSREQMDLLSPAFTWAQANPEAGAKVLGAIEQYTTICGKWDALPKDAAVAATLKRALEDLRAQFAKARVAFMQSASKLGGVGVTAGDMEVSLDEVKRLYDVVEDVLAMGASTETLNAYKLRPVGGLEKRITTAAIAAAAPAPAAARNDGQRYLDAVHTLATFSQTLSAKPPTDLPAAVSQTWAGGKLDAFDNRWKGIIVELAGSLVTGASELDKSRVARLEQALALQEALRSAAQLEAALPHAPELARWVDWAIDPAALQVVLAPYRESTSGAFFGFASDNPEQVDKWTRLHGRYAPLIALVVRDAAYAEQCKAMPIGFAADVARLASNVDGAPFGTERYASYAIGVWAILERTGEYEAADRTSVSLAKRLQRDLHLTGPIDEKATRTSGGSLKRPRD